MDKQRKDITVGNTTQEIFDEVNKERLAKGLPYHEGPSPDDVWWNKMRIQNDKKEFKNILLEEYTKQQKTKPQ